MNNKKKGINLKKFFIYTAANIFIFVISVFLLLFINKVLNFNLQLSNLISETLGLLILFTISRKFIFFQSKNRGYTKLLFYFCARYTTIIIFSILITKFLILSELIVFKFQLSLSSNEQILLAKFLIIPFSIIINFLITYFTIEKIEKFLD